MSPDIISLFNHPSNTVSCHRDCIYCDNLNLPLNNLLYGKLVLKFFFKIWKIVDDVHIHVYVYVHVYVLIDGRKLFTQCDKCFCYSTW